MRSIGATLLAILVSLPAAAADSIAKIQLPCDSRSQTLSPTGTQVAVRCKDRSLHLMSIPAGAEDKVFPADQRANTFTYSRDGRWLAFGFSDGTVEVAATQSGGASTTLKSGTRRVDLLYFLPDSKNLFVAPVDSPGQVWSLTGTPKLLASLPVDFGGINAAATSHDGTLLVTASDDTVLRWYDTTTWKKTREYRDFLLEPFALAFTADGKHVLAGGADSRITVLDASTAKQTAQLPAEAGWYIGDLLMLDGDRVVTVYLDNAGEKPPRALIWDLVSSKSESVTARAQPTCGGVVAGKLWVCTVEGETLTISQQ